MIEFIQLRFKRPSFLLGFLLATVLIGFVAFVYWQMKVLDPEHESRLVGQQWVLLIAATTATIGWIITSWINVRNSVKQHTINTLLQSRLSVEYMKHASNVGKHYTKVKNLGVSIRPGSVPDSTDDVVLDEHSLQYVLNYFEFIALGIRAGDLHEPLLRDSLRSIVSRNVEMSKDWIDACRSEHPRLYENLGWLQNRWSPKSTQIGKCSKTRW